MVSEATATLQGARLRTVDEVALCRQSPPAAQGPAEREVTLTKMLESVERVLLSETAGDFGRDSLAPDEDLLAQGLIDSLGIIKLTAALEKEFGIKVADEDVVPENFQSLASIARFVEKKRQGQ